MWDASPEVISKRYPGALHKTIQADAVVLSYPTGFDDKAPLLHIPYTLVTEHGRMKLVWAMEASALLTHFHCVGSAIQAAGGSTSTVLPWCEPWKLHSKARPGKLQPWAQ